MKGATPSQYGKTRREKEAERKASKRQVPIPNYDELGVGEILEKLERLPSRDWNRVYEYERNHKKRTTLLDRLRGRSAD